MSNKESVTVYINLELAEQGKRLLDALRPKGEWIDAVISVVYAGARLIVMTIGTSARTAEQT